MLQIGDLVRALKRTHPIGHASIVIGDAGIVAPARITKLIANARTGHRIVVIDEGSTIARDHADQTRDGLIDLARGNWDFFADHPDDHFLDRAANAMISPNPDFCHAAARIMLKHTFRHVGDGGAVSLGHVRAAIRMITPTDIMRQASIDPDHAQAARLAMTVAATLAAVSEHFADADPRLPRVSVARWLQRRGETILFVNADNSLGLRDGEIAALVGALSVHAAMIGYDVTLDDVCATLDIPPIGTLQ